MGLLNISNMWSVHQQTKDRDTPEDKERMFKNVRPVLS
jgi:hypothetical protein